MDLTTRKDQIIEELAGIDQKGIFSFVACTEEKALKKSRVSGMITPENLISVRKYMYATVSLGNNYQQAVNNRLKKEGKEKSFETQETYTMPVSNNGILLKHKEKDQYYIRVYPNLCHSFTTIVKYFDVNGVEITKEEYQRIKQEFLPIKGDSSNQGLDDPIMVRNYKVENVLWLKRGDFNVTNLTQEMINLLRS
jgi:hypothetical protein